MINLELLTPEERFLLSLYPDHFVCTNQELAEKTGVRYVPEEELDE